MFRIFYGDSDVFMGVAPLPFVERSRNSVDFADKWGWDERFVLQGRIIGKCLNDEPSLDDMWERKSRLLNNFKKQFQNFYIVETGEAPIYSGETAVVRSITFDESSYVNDVGFSITLDVWNSGNFSGTYGVMEPADTVVFTDTEKGLVGVSRTISAQGLNVAGKTAYENAKDYVEGRSGVQNITATPLFADAPDTGSMFLEAENINANRLEGSYTISQEWVYDFHNTGNYTGTLVRTNTATSSGDNQITVAVNGTIVGGLTSTDDQLRDAYSGLNLYNIANAAYNEVGGGTLFDRYVTSSVNENLKEKEISFSSVYTDSEKDDISVNDSFTVSRTFENGRYCANASVVIRSTYGSVSERWDRVTGYYDTFDIRQFLLNKWNEYGYSASGTMAGGVDSFSVTKDSGNAIIRVAGSMCQKATTPPSGFDGFRFTLGVRPASDTYIEHAGLEQLGDRTIQKLDGKTRSVYTIQGSATKEECIGWSGAYEQLEAKINSLRDEYLVGMGTSDGILTNYVIETGQGATKNSATFTASWSYKGGAIF